MIKNIFNQLKYSYQNLMWHIKRKNNLEINAKLFYDEHYNFWPVKDEIVLYDIRDGYELDDSPFAILRYWLSSRPKMRHVIVTRIETKEKMVRILNQWHLNQNKNIILVDYYSTQHMKTLLTAKYVITNAMIFSDIFVKRSEQIFVNTWHGTPLKKMGYAMPGGVMGSWNVIRTLMMTDYLIMPNDYSAQIFRRDYRLDGLYTGKITLIGYPRNDVLVNRVSPYQANKVGATTISAENIRTILYAPTWSGDTTKITSSDEELDKYLSVLDKISKLQDTQIRFKPHPYFKEKIDEDIRFKPYRLNDAIGTNEVLSEVDILITDYSSLFFDFLVTNNPIIFFDVKKNYAEERGEYLQVSSLPGPYTKDSDELVKLLENTQSWFEKYRKTYQQFKEKFVSLDDGHASKRVTREISSILASKELPQRTIIVNGEDFSDTSFSDTRLVNKLSKKYDVSMVAFESHLLDNWYGQIFFKHIDEVMPVSRIFINKNDIHHKNLTTELAYIDGKRITGGKIFDIMVIFQKKFSYHQKIIMATTKTIIMTKNIKREMWITKLGFIKYFENERFQVWQVQSELFQIEIETILKELELC